MSFQIPAARSDATHFVLSGICELPVARLNDVPGKDRLSILPLRNGSDLDLQKYDVHGGSCVCGNSYSALRRGNRFRLSSAGCFSYGVFFSFLSVFLEIITPSDP